MHCMLQSYVARPSIIGIACSILAPLGNVSSLMSVLLCEKNALQTYYVIASITVSRQSYSVRDLTSMLP